MNNPRTRLISATSISPNEIRNLFPAEAVMAPAGDCSAAITTPVCNQDKYVIDVNNPVAIDVRFTTCSTELLKKQQQVIDIHFTIAIDVGRTTCTIGILASNAIATKLAGKQIAS